MEGENREIREENRGMREALTKAEGNRRNSIA